jgi:hypothetical protein
MAGRQLLSRELLKDEVFSKESSWDSIDLSRGGLGGGLDPFHQFPRSP